MAAIATSISLQDLHDMFLTDEIIDGMPEQDLYATLKGLKRRVPNFESFKNLTVGSIDQLGIETARELLKAVNTIAINLDRPVRT